MQEDLFRKQKKKEFLIVLLICMICVSAAIWGAAAFSKGNKTKEPSEENQIVDLNETTNTAHLTEQETTTSTSDNIEQNKVVNSQVSKPDISVRPEYETKEASSKKDNLSVNSITNTESAHSSDASDTVTNAEVETNAPHSEPESVAANSPTATLTFSNNSVLSWPIQGSVILEYNMDNTIYFPTLDSYRCNPAMVIQGDLGMDVLAAAPGSVKEVGTNEEIGNYLVVSLGDNYELTYGQLSDICVQEGDFIETSQKIACVAEPSNYYLREGRNLYFKLTHNGEPVDPLDFLE